MLGYTKSSAAATKIWKRREALQKLITLHVKKIRSQQMYRNRDPKELAKMVTSMCSNDVVCISRFTKLQRICNFESVGRGGGGITFNIFDGHHWTQRKPYIT